MDRIRRMGVLTPGVYLVDQVQRKIYMEYLGDEAMTVKSFLYQLGTFDHPGKLPKKGVSPTRSFIMTLILLSLFVFSFGLASGEDCDIAGWHALR